MNTSNSVEERIEALQSEVEAQDELWARLSKEIEATDAEIHLTELPDFEAPKHAPAIAMGIRV